MEKVKDTHAGTSGALNALIAPASIAVVGASAKKLAWANAALRNLTASGYDGDLQVVHREADEIEGVDTVRSIAEIPGEGPIDTALVSIPAAAVAGTLEQLVDRGCRAAVVPAVGLTSADRQAIDGLVERSGIAICGPNTMGLINVADDIPMVFWEGFLTEPPRGRTALITQSGGASLAVVRSTEGVGFSRIIPSGNEWFTTSADYLRWLAEDPATDAVALVFESLQDVGAFTEAVAELRSQGKRLVGLHVGSSPLGAAATVAHTAALVGYPELYAAYFEEIDVPLVRDYDELAAVLTAFAAPFLPPATGRKVAAVTVSGGLAAITADIASERGIELARLAEGTQSGLATALPGSEPLNPFDTGGGTSYSPEGFTEAIRILAADPEVGSVMAVLDAQAGLTDAELAYEEEDFAATAAAVERIDLPVVVASTSAASIHPGWTEGSYDRLVVLRGIANAMVALRALVMNRAPVDVPAPSARRADRSVAPPVCSVLPAAAAQRLLEAHGVASVRSRLVETPVEVGRAAAELGCPVVVKVSSADIPHRSEYGGVVTGVADAEGAVAAAELIAGRIAERAPAATIEGFEVQEEISTRLQAIVGSVVDPVFGPVISVGLGGVLVELIADSAIARAPLDLEGAVRLLERTYFARLAGGFRKLVEPTSLRPLAELLVNFSDLLVEREGDLIEIDLNPVLVEEGNGRAVVADVLMVGVDR